MIVLTEVSLTRADALLTEMVRDASEIEQNPAFSQQLVVGMSNSEIVSLFAVLTARLAYAEAAIEALDKQVEALTLKGAL